jgi:uncharacterized protein
MPLIFSDFKTTKPLVNNGHFQTIAAYFLSTSPRIGHDRIRMNTRDGDFLDLDMRTSGSKHLVILSHGLEGRSDASYMRGMMKYFTEHDRMDVLAWNMRSCSGELNKKSRFYHSASIEDLEDVIHYAESLNKYDKITLVGFSMGGNITANYLGRHGKNISSKVVNAVIFSSPLHLTSSAKALDSSKVAALYRESFLKTLRQKIIQKTDAGIIDIDLNIDKILRSKTFTEFDELVTAPLHGYKSAKDYQHQASASFHVGNIQCPTLIVQAKNDPFLTRQCFPLKLARKHRELHLEIATHGGHLGFFHFKKGLVFWSEKRASEFIKKTS